MQTNKIIRFLLKDIGRVFFEDQKIVCKFLTIMVYQKFYKRFGQQCTFNVSRLAIDVSRLRFYIYFSFFKKR